MYKVFINDKVIIITSSIKGVEDVPVYTIEDAVFDELIHKLRYTSLSKLYIFALDEEKALQSLLSTYKVITAGGGLVKNSENDFLFIYRGSRWDLPKGRAEQRETIEETAIREVEEECGISELTIKNFLLKTYHIYFLGKTTEIKETYWFLMESSFKGDLKPQLEEGITEVGFKSESEIPKLFKNTYNNIILVYQEYVKRLYQK